MLPWTLASALAPLIIFYAMESWWGLEAALGGAIIWAVGDLAWQHHRRGQVDKVTLFSAGLVVGLGGLSLLTQDERFVLLAPVIADLLFAAILLFSLRRGGSLLASLAAKQAPELTADPIRRGFLRGMTARLALGLILHAAATAIAANHSREIWLFVSGPLQYIILGVQAAFELVYTRWVLRAQLDRWDEAHPLESKDP